MKFLGISAMVLGVGIASVQAAPGPWVTTDFFKETGVVSSVSVAGGQIAVGFTAGAVRITDLNLKNMYVVTDPGFGAKGRIHSVEWFGGNLWIASQKGLYRFDPVAARIERAASGISSGLRTGAKVLRVQDGALWVASSKRLAKIVQAGGEAREWNLPQEVDPTCLLRVAGRILVGTDSKGLMILDTTSERWVEFGKQEGLSSNQVTGLERSEDQVFVATPMGIDALDISSLQARAVAPTISVSWMSQVNGALYATTLDGLQKIDSKTFESKPVDVPKGCVPEGNLGFGQGILAVGCGASLAVRVQPTFLGYDNLRPTPEGFRLKLPAALPAAVSLRAHMRLPEWPAVEIPMTSQVSGRDAVFAIPSDTKGRLQIDIQAMAGSKVLETRSLEDEGDRAKPVLVVDPGPAVVATREITLSGSVSGMEPLSLNLLPAQQKLSLGKMGEFKQRVRLVAGYNRFDLRLRDGLGTEISREFTIKLDDQAPEILPVPPDTVEGPVARMRIPYRDAGEVKIAFEPSDGVRATVLDSFVLVEARGLEYGDNFWRITMEDPAGNRSTSKMSIFRLGESVAVPGRPDTIRVRDTVRAVSGCPQGESGSSIHVVRYRMELDETIRKVARKFYGDKELESILIRWNGLEDSAIWRHMPVGTVIEVPIWKDIEHGEMPVRSTLKSFPWDRIPKRKDQQ